MGIFSSKIIFTIEKQEETIEYLTQIYTLLREQGYSVHAKFIKSAISALLVNDMKLYANRITSIDIWGGSGSVIDIDIRNEDLQKKLNYLLFKVLDSNKEVGISFNGMDRIYKYYSGIINDQIK